MTDMISGTEAVARTVAVSDAAETVLELRAATKRYAGVPAIEEVDFTLRRGEIHALLGENGAGKSTLVKIATGVHEADAGEIRLAGSPVRFGSPAAAQRAGISTVYQEVNLCPNLSVADNILLGREPTRAGRIRGRDLRSRAAALVSRFGLEIDVASPLDSHPLAVQQLVAIVRAVAVEARVLILDEPTSSLDRGETARLFGLMRRLRDEGVAICFVTHFLDQIYEVCDRLTVLRGGRVVGEHEVSGLDRVGLVRLMIGKDLADLDALAGRHGPAPTGGPLLSARGTGRRGAIEPFDLDVGAGEVVGLAGLLGSGRTELARLLAGADAADSGTVTIRGKAVALRSPTDAIGHGIAFCSENRKAEGLIPELTVRENIVLALQAARGWIRPVPARQRDELVARYIAALDIRPADPEVPAGSLSGGNQQKLLLARWLITRPALLVLDEPTRGIDIGAKAEIQKLVVALSEEGMAVLFISAELEEVLRLSHTVGVLRDRRLVARLANGMALTTERVMATIASGEAA
jgi:simple sugar transport system ATP-binding protein